MEEVVHSKCGILQQIVDIHGMNGFDHGSLHRRKPDQREVRYRDWHMKCGGYGE